MVIVASPRRTYCSCSTVLVWRGIPPPFCMENLRRAKLGPSCEEIRTWIVVSLPAATFFASTSLECLIDIIYLLISRRFIFVMSRHHSTPREAILPYGFAVFVGQGVYV